MATKKFKWPNIFIIGTPGTGKSTLASKLAEISSSEHINLSKIIVSENLYEMYDKEYDSYIIDEEKTINFLTDLMKKDKKYIVEYHGCDFVPPHWFDLVIVLRTEIEILNERYTKRNYSTLKCDQNIEAEIFQILLDEAIDHFGVSKVLELQSNSMQDIDDNIEIIISKLKAVV